MDFQINELVEKKALSSQRITLLKQSINHELKNTSEILRERAFERKFIEEIKWHLDGVDQDLLETCSKNLYLYFNNHKLSELNYLDIFTNLRLISRNETTSYHSLYHWLLEMCDFTGTREDLLDEMFTNNEINVDWIDKSAFEELDPVVSERIEKHFSIEESKRKSPFSGLALWFQWMIALTVLAIVLMILAVIVSSFRPVVSATDQTIDFTMLSLESTYDATLKELVSTTHQTPKEFLYQPLNFSSTREFLRSRDSMLNTDNYLATISRVAKLNNINPYLLLSIIGQEQNFVPATDEHAEQIINNPFNLYGSWTEYQGTFQENTQITCNTIHDHFKDYSGTDPFIHLNKRYAEDPNWNNGVRYFFEMFVPSYKTH